MIDRVNIEHWADTFTAQGDFPDLIRRLVYASTPNLLKADIPYGSAVNLKGLDGDVETAQATPFLPSGRIIMEFGTNANFKVKANDDYVKRTGQQINNLDKTKTTYIFMTPRCWGNKNDWVEAKKNDRVWRDVLVYDSVFLAQWISSVPSVEIWFAGKVGIPVQDLVLGSERLEELLTGPFKLDPFFYLVGRETQAVELRKMIKSPTLRAIRASSKEEAMGFILSAANMFPNNEKEAFYDKTVVVENKAAFRQMRSQTSVINLVPEFDEPSVLYKAVSDGKVVLVPLGPSDEFNQDVIDLPASDRFGLEEILKKAGVEEEKARRIVKDCSCNLTMIKKSLGFPILRVDWLNDDSILDILPALIVERWNENYDGDKDILEYLSGNCYDVFKQKMIFWSHKSVSPVMNVGDIWRLTSPLSLWADMSSRVSRECITNLKGITNKIFNDEGNCFSYQIKEGILNSLILIAWHGEQLFGDADIYQTFVDEIIKGILYCADKNKWNTISNFLPLIAEASPGIFIEEVNRSLSLEDAPVLSLFVENEGLFAPEAKHPNLLWALESLAWLPPFLKPVTDLLLRLSEIDPGGSLANRPFNSLVDIYLPWLPHTMAGFDERMAILEALSNVGYAKMWDFLLALLPKQGAITSGTHQLKWRGYDLSVSKRINHREWLQTTDYVCDLLMKVYDGTDQQLAECIDKIESIPNPTRKKVIIWIVDEAKKFKGNAPKTRKSLRETLWLQNYLEPNDERILLESEIFEIKKAYESTTPIDIIEKNRWLFDESVPRVPIENNNKEDYCAEEVMRKRLRTEALTEWIMVMTLDRIVALGKELNEPYVYGQTLAEFHYYKGLNDKVFSLLLDEDARSFTKGYIIGLEREIGEDGLITILREREKTICQDAILIFLLDMYGTKTVYEYVEKLDENIQKLYWMKYPQEGIGHQGEETLYVINKLVMVGRSFDAINGTWYIVKDIPTEVIQTLMKATLTDSLEHNGRFDTLAIETYMEELHKRDDADQDLLFKLEWDYSLLLKNHPAKGIFKLLFRKLACDPLFFVDLLTYLYRPEHDKEETIEHENVEKGQLHNKNNALRAYYLLNEWSLIPGVDNHGKVDKSILKQWIDEALKHAKVKDRLKYAYLQLGILFSKYPESSEYWPPMELFEVMESLNNKTLFKNYNVGMFNKRGFTSRGGYEGGDIERDNANYFRDLYNKCIPLYPNVAKEFQSLAEQYVRMAKEIDDEATIAKLDY